MKIGERNRAGVEILAPAGSKEGLVAAIGAGADAVYVGGVCFGARAYANNLEEKELCEAIDYVHLHSKRIYLTVNTLLKPEEMGDALYRYLKPYYEQGIDAVIVQDAGVLKFISEEFPGLSIHASTQMSLAMAEGVACFSDYPVTRLVNARELGLFEIQRIRKQCGLEIESFVHGALCYCYSGQCLMSSMIGGRSGNRGRCAQPCRLAYNGAYLLSPKDICTLDMIPELIGAGIDSFKIEGRMKRYEYAAGVTAAYRREVDRYFTLGEEGYKSFHQKHPEVLLQAVEDLKDLYNRGGFTKGYYVSRNGKAMMSTARPNHSGVKVARVEEVRGNRALLCAQKELHAQDVLEIRMGEGEGENYEFTLGQAHLAGERFFANFTPGLLVQKKDPVYRTKNNLLLTRISEEYLEKKPRRAVEGKLVAKVGEPLELLVCTAGGKEDVAGGDDAADTHKGQVLAKVKGGIVQCAKKQPMGAERLRAALEKTGDTPFYFSGIDMELSGDIFLPVSALNALRREALAVLESRIAKGYRRVLPAKKEEVYKECNGGDGEPKNQVGKKNGMLKRGMQNCIHVCVMTGGQFEAVLCAGRVKRVYYDLAAFAAGGIYEAARKAKEAGIEFFLRLPRICRAGTYDKLRDLKGCLLGDFVDGYLIQNMEELYLFAIEWRVFDMGKILVADAMLYVMNGKAKQFFREFGVEEFTAPYELNAKELSVLGLEDMALPVYGRLPLMVSAQCVKKNTKEECDKMMEPLYLTDRKQKKLPVLNFCCFCYNVVYGYECLSLLGCPEVNDLAPASFRYDFTLETEDEVRKILEKDELPKNIEFTKGHFRRGVL